MLKSFRSKTTEALCGFHQHNPLLRGIEKYELKSKIPIDIDRGEYDAVLKSLEEEKTIKFSGNIVSLADFEPRLDEKQLLIYEKLESIYIDAGYSPPPISETVTDRQTREVFNMMARDVLTPLGEGIFIHRSFIEEAKRLIRAYCEEHGRITLAEFRDMTNSSRKYCLLILNYFDDRRFTMRDGDARALGRKS